MPSELSWGQAVRTWRRLMSKPGAEVRQAGYSTYVLFILIVVYTFNFIDRQIIGILSVPIQEELGVSDTVIGLMRGFSFAIFYSLLGVPIAMLADRKNRTVIITVALAMWSAMTAVCGLATSVWQLFFARMMVGVGEAGGVAPSYSLISDYFPPEQRARALAVYSFGIPIGSAIGIVFGGVIATLLDWRTAFFLVGALGILLAPIFKLTVKEPVRGGFDAPSATRKPASIGEVFRTLRSKKSFWTLALGAASSAIMGYGVFAWFPAFFVRSHGDALTEYLQFLPGWMFPEGSGALLSAAYFYGFIVLVGGVIGLFLGGLLADTLGRSSRRAYALVPAVAFVFTIPLYVVGVLTPSLTVAFFVLLVPTALGLAWVGPTVSAFQHIVPLNMRATSTAVFLLINSLIGIGAGDVIIGFISDSLSHQYGDESLRYSILLGSGFYLVAAIFFYVSSLWISADWEEA